jgi:hypothetical protein
MRLLTLALAASLCLPPPAHAVPSRETAKALYEDCTADDDTYLKVAYCVGQIRGMVIGAQIAFTAEELTLCYPDDVRNRELLQAFLDYYRDNPSKRLEPAFVTVVLSVTARWPCAGGKR